MDAKTNKEIVTVGYKMKEKYLLFFFTLLVFQFCLSQEYETIKETKKIIDSRDIYLNGGLRSQFGGKSRTTIKIDLPPNTVEWYYSFTTSQGKKGTANLNLAFQLTGMLADPSGISSNTLSAIKVPEGDASVDIYLMDHYNNNLFMRKADYNGEAFTQYSEGMVENTKQAIVRVDDVIEGSWYLGIRNPSSLNALNLSLEVVAITEEIVEIPDSSLFNSKSIKNNKDMFTAIGPVQLLLVLLIPTGIFFLGFYFGKKAGYIKRVKETENRDTKN
ncbi:hypothetical protein KXJ69_05435 [Aureisphaera sp. CAU 1614]|uniref:Uncharacterized protein n=1 Tax=Halomarinibacterium sedimenti TaxID=2857106 RepID=A0A9X1FN81_9FLAO|nr:hypothetical protein [Halomarinibacterium sedimenti]MBW2937537.1 hypothetical protein [Halomarinibacterium sedimenti]